jgi:hypothetical protein
VAPVGRYKGNQTDRLVYLFIWFLNEKVYNI